MDVGISGLRNRALRAYLDDIKVVFFVSDLSAYDVTGCEVETVSSCLSIPCTQQPLF